MVDLLCEAMEAKIEHLEKKNSQLEEEKKSQLSQSLLEKIPECPVNSHLRSQLQTNHFNALFLRSVLSSSRRTSPSSAAWPDITSVEAARRPSR